MNVSDTKVLDTKVRKRRCWYNSTNTDARKLSTWREYVCIACAWNLARANTEVAAQTAPQESVFFCVLVTEGLIHWSLKAA